MQERLTKEDRYGHFYTNKANCRNVYSKDGENLEGVYFENHTLAIDGTAIEKLGKLEDLEEELGCPIDVVVKALKNGVYVLDEETGGTKLILRGFINSTQDYEDGTFGFIDDRYWAMKKLEVTGLCVPIYYAWKDYKKTWWLKETKEE